MSFNYFRLTETYLMLLIFSAFCLLLLHCLRKLRHLPPHAIAKQQGRQISCSEHRHRTVWQLERARKRIRWQSFHAPSFSIERTCCQAFTTNKLSECKSEKQAAHQSCSGSLPRKCVTAAWKGKLGQFSVQFGSGLQFNSTAKTDQKIYSSEQRVHTVAVTLRQSNSNRPAELYRL